MNSEAAAYFLGALPDNLETTELEPSRTLSHSNSSAHRSVDVPPSCDHAREVESPQEPTNASDETLFELLHERNREALGILFHRYARVVRAIAFRILRNAAEADDLVQEVFLFLFRRSALFDPQLGSASSWIAQVTYHRAIDRRRYLASRHFYQSVELEDDIMNVHDLRREVAFYEQSLEGALGKEALRTIDNALSDDQRRTIQLYFFEGHTLEEIAGLLGQTVRNIRNHYYRGLEEMRRQIFRAKLRVK